LAQWLLVPSISRRYSPACKSAFSNFCALRDINGLADWLGKYRHRQRGYRKQCEASKKRIGFMRVNFFPLDESAEGTTPGADGVDTQARERVDFPHDTSSSWTNGGKMRVNRPAAATAGFLMFVLTDLMRFAYRLHSYRRSFPSNVSRANANFPF